MNEIKKTIDDCKRLKDAFSRFSDVTKVFLDSFALVSMDGDIIECSQLFALLVGAKKKKILRSAHLSNYITFSVHDKPIGYQDFTASTNATRIDEVSGYVPSSQATLKLIISVFPIKDDTTSETLGILLLIRNITPETNLQYEFKSKALESITDKLTGLYTRSYFEEYLPELVSRMRQEPAEMHYPISVLMCDIDYFKHINDTFGHQAGDHFLQKLGKIMTSTFRKTDTCCRYGGEEFLIILPTANLENACKAAEKLRRNIENAVFEFKGQRINVTISCGVATIDIFHETAENTISRADAALYYSKNHGRNSISYHNKSKISPFVSTLRSTVKNPKVS